MKVASLKFNCLGEGKQGKENDQLCPTEILNFQLSRLNDLH